MGRSHEITPCRDGADCYFIKTYQNGAPFFQLLEHRCHFATFSHPQPDGEQKQSDPLDEKEDEPAEDADALNPFVYQNTHRITAIGQKTFEKRHAPQTKTDEELIAELTAEAERNGFGGDLITSDGELLVTGTHAPARRR